MKGLKYINISNYLLTGLIIIILGVFIIIGSQDLYFSVINLMIYIFLIRSLSELIGMIIGKNKIAKEKLISIIVNTIFAGILIFFDNITLSVLPLIFSMYLFFNSYIKIVNFILLSHEKYYKKFIELLFGIIFFIIGIIFAFSPIFYLPSILTFIGVYCILLGLDSIKSFLFELIPISKNLRTIRISLPSILEAFLPVQMLNYINTYFNEEKEIENIVKNNDDYNLEILIHTSSKNENKLGHMDLYFNNKVISYGNYDPSSRRFSNLIGDGVIFEANKEKYIPFCIEHSSKTLIGFGLKLTDEEFSKIVGAYDKIKENTYEWDLKQLDKKKYKNYYSKLLKKNTCAKFYKFKSGEFKKYFVFGSNCTKFAEKILGSSTNILKLVGVITPGTYLDYLEHEFHRKNSNVVYKKIYNEKTKEIF